MPAGASPQGETFMKRKLLFLIMVVALMMAFCISANALEGSGTQADPYIIKSESDFTQISNSTSAHYKLDADLEFSSDTGAIIESEFKGVFDGNGHTVKLTINALTDQSGDTLDALFALVSGQIKNLTVTGSVNGSNKTAGIVAKLFSSGNIDNCVNYATVYGRKNVAGIAGVLFDTATVTNCKNYGTISGKSINKGVDLGGIVGCVWYTGASHKSIINCYNAGTLEGNGNNVGGIVGFFYSGKIENCFSTGELNSTDDNSRGIIFGCTDQAGTHTVDGYFGLGEEDYIGTKNGNVKMGAPMLESTGVAIYLGSGSGIRGEFHLDEDAYNTFCTLVGIDKSNIEYGAVVTTKIEAQALNGILNSQEAIDGGKVSFAPALKNGEKQYFFVDETKEGYHSYRVALTGFADTAKAYNTEFVILGYVKFIDANGNEQIVYVNTVESARLASSVEGTKLNAVNIVRVAEATLEDGDYTGNQDALDTLNHIADMKAYTNWINIDGTVEYGHSNATFTKHVGNDTATFKILNTFDIEIADYIASLLENGYTKLSENEHNGNKFYLYEKNGVLINIAYFPTLNEVTISKQDGKTPSNLVAKTYETKNGSTITQIQLSDEGNIKEGMSYVIHLADGTFFIVDGGWCENDYLEADKLYNVLVDLNGSDDGIVIAGWIFTHCHGDHIGTFNYFVEKYHADVTINQLVYNFPPDDEIRASASSYMLDSSKQRYSYFRSMIETHLPNVEIVTARSGYKLYYANAEVEILQTFEDLYPSTVANYDFNSSSTIFTVKVDGQKIMFIGDVSDVGASRYNNMFASTVKCDFVQVAHHGLNSSGTIAKLYENVGAKYVLYPACEDWYRSHIGDYANAYLENNQTVKQIFVSGFMTVTLDLPYDGTAFDGDKHPAPKVEIPTAQKPTTSVEVPNAYFDLDFVDGTAVDAKGNATVTVVGGSIEETTVDYNGQEKTGDAFVVEKGNSHYMTVNFNDITTDEQWGEFVMNSVTFEIFLKLDNLPGKTVGLITSCNSGGTTLYLREKAGGQLTFQIGSTERNSNGQGSNYSATSDMNGTTPVAYAGDLIHVLGTFNAETNMMSLYINGILVASADYGNGTFLGGKGNDYVIGIGYNPQYSGEVLGSYAGYELYEARIYGSSFTDEQVAQQYWNCVDNLLTGGNQ